MRCRMLIFKLFSGHVGGDIVSLDPNIFLNVKAIARKILTQLSEKLTRETFKYGSRF